MSTASIRATACHTRGISLVECLITMAVLAIAVGSSLPGFAKALATRHLEGAAAQLETDIQHARSLAVAANQSVRLSFRQDAAGSCYLVHTGAADACNCAANGSAICQGSEFAARSVRFSNAGPLQLHSNVGSIVFDPAKGTSTPTGTLKLSTADARAVHLVVNLMGRVRTCSPGAGVTGYLPC